jgi:capsular polysaccharide export protein
LKVLTTVFFKDFARYFNYLEDELMLLDKSIEFFNISIYPCAYKYWLKNNKHSVLLPKAVNTINSLNMKDILLKNNYKNIDLDEIIRFNYKSQLMYGFDKKEELKMQAIKYIYFFDNLFKTNHFDFFISSGDSRMLVEISIIFAKRNNVKIYYFEQGPFGTTMIDEKGVNCNISFMDRKILKANINKEKLNNFIYIYKNNKKDKYWKFEKRNLSDKISNLKTFYWMYPCKYLTKLVPIDVQIGSFLIPNLFTILKNKIIQNKRNNPKEYLPKNSITFIMQVPVDAQLIDNSPLYDNFYVMLKDIYEALPSGYNLVVREHPNYFNKYDEKIYEYINNNDNIFLLNNVSLDETLKNSKLIILNNSTVGIEALTYYKTVLTLGNAYYNRNQITYHLDDRKNLQQLILKALENPTKKKDIDIFLYNFIFDYLYHGHFQDAKLSNINKIARDIMEEIS